MSTVKKSARKALIWLGAIVVAMYALLAVGVFSSSASWTPGLALDLAGGRQIILTPMVDQGEIDEGDLEQAVEIIRRRIDAKGVAESEVSTQYPNIVVSLPGNPDAATVDLVRQSAQLQFRPVLIQGDPSPLTAAVEPSASPSASADPSVVVSPTVDASASASPSASEASHQLFSEAVSTASATVSPEPTPTPSATATPAAVDPVIGETDPSSFDWITADISGEFSDLNCLDPANLAGRALGNPETGHVACDQFGQSKYVMGPVEMSGTDLATATSGPELSQTGTLTGRYEVRLDFTSTGAAKFADITERIKDLESPRNQFAMVLDGAVISAPAVSTAITGGEAQITGNFTQDEAEQLANQLKFGALPLTLTVQSDEQISATLGAEQLRNGLIAGAIGMVLVFIYSLIQYRALGLVTVGSLLIAGVLSYVVITLLSWGIGYRLSLAGVAGLIVAIGITADSFIVYFERVRDELREGRSLQSAIDHAWVRARRTILASDAISLLAAVVLYTLAVGGVRGFAFTLGLTTLVDILVVFMFTHPVLVLLGRTKFFSTGHKYSGLDPQQLGRGRRYKGRGAVATTMQTSGVDATDDGLTLAERKAAQRKAAQPVVVDATNPSDGDGQSASAEGEK